ncbi:MAG: septum formation initiator family protein [Chitinophagaceae bacterium]|nr:septum formation initiator family protein [Chitinophagaceae bacterium]
MGFINRYKFYILGGIFVVWVLFFAQYNIISLINQKQELNDMKEKISFLKKEIEMLESKNKSLENNPKAIERTARENYFMKKENEEVFIIDSLKK